MVVGAEAVAIDGRLGRPGGVDLDAGRRGRGGTGRDREMSRGGTVTVAGQACEEKQARRGEVWYGTVRNQAGTLYCRWLWLWPADGQRLCSADDGGGGGGGCAGGPELRVGCGGVVQTFRLVCVPGCGCVGGLWRAAARDREGRVATGRLRAATARQLAVARWGSTLAALTAPGASTGVLR